MDGSELRLEPAAPLVIRLVPNIAGDVASLDSSGCHGNPRDFKPFAPVWRSNGYR
jgi:hypothetical protein